MSNAKHTPGPWKTDNETPATGIYVTAEDRHIANVIDIGAGYTQQMADARLIAAAPELLAALDELEQYARAFSISGVYLSDEIEGARLLAKACDAIAKAKGE